MDIAPAVIGALVGAFLGVLLTVATGWANRKRMLAASWQALRAEIENCHLFAEAYLAVVEGRLGQKVALPLTRWPNGYYLDMMKTIISEDDIEEAEITHIIRFYNLVDQINLGLDHAVAADQSGDETKRTTEIGRVKLKAKHFIADDPGDLYSPAIQVANRHHQRFQAICWKLLFLKRPT